MRGVTGTPLRLLGMAQLAIGIGEQGTSKMWFPVVPDNYIGCDILLGCDVLGQAQLTWDHHQGTLTWGGTLHPARYVARRHGKVERVHLQKEALESLMPTLRVHTPVEIPLLKTAWCPVNVPEIPGTDLLVFPHHGPFPEFVTRVTESRQVFIPLYNSHKRSRHFKPGTIWAHTKEQRKLNRRPMKLT